MQRWREGHSRKRQQLVTAWHIHAWCGRWGVAQGEDKPDHVALYGPNQETGSFSKAVRSYWKVLRKGVTLSGTCFLKTALAALRTNFTLKAVKTFR